MPNKKKKTYKFLFVSADKCPPFRVDVAVLFGKELASRGHEIDWILQSEADCEKGYVTIWRGNKVYVGPTDNGKSTVSRIRKYLLRILHSFKMIAIVKKNNYDFIQVKDLFFPAVLAAVVSKFNKTPFFYWLSYPIPESYIYQYKTKDSKYYNFFLIVGIFIKLLLYKVILPAANHVFAQSEQMKQDLIAEGIPEERITPVPMGIEIDSQYPYMESDASIVLDPGKKMVYLGTMVKVRRLDFLLRVLKLVLQRNIFCKLYMVGGSEDPKDMHWLKKTALDLGIEDQVVFTGNLPRNEAFEYVRQADVCLSPFAPIPILNSTSPTKLVEYLYWGKAAVVNDHPEQRRVIEESDGGICVPYDENAFSDAVVTLLNDKKMATEMGQNGRKYVLENRDYRIIASRLEKSYLKILE